MNHQIAHNPLRILVLVGNYHGVCESIANRIGAVLRSHGHQLTIRSFRTAPADLMPYDVYIFGSPVHHGFWSNESRQFIKRHSDTLQYKPVYIYTSAPVADPSTKPELKSVNIDSITRHIVPREHKVFRNNLTPYFYAQYGQHIGQPYGGKTLVHPNYDDVEAWALHIGAQLKEGLRAR